jgi:hypothetical protein
MKSLSNQLLLCVALQLGLTAMLLPAQEAATSLSWHSIATLRLGKTSIDGASLAEACRQVSALFNLRYPNLPALDVKFDRIDAQGPVATGPIKLDLENPRVGEVLRYCGEIATFKLTTGNDGFSFGQVVNKPSIKREYVLSDEVLRTVEEKHRKPYEREDLTEFLRERFGLHVMKMAPAGEGLQRVVGIGPESAHGELERALVRVLYPTPFRLTSPDGTGLRSQ